METNTIFQGDCRDLLKSSPLDFFALSLWSPPYFVGKEYERHISFEDWKQLLQEVIELHVDVIRPGGFLAINIADIKCFADSEMPRISSNNISRKRHAVTKEMILTMQSRYPSAKKRELAEKLGCSDQTIDRRLNGTNVRGGKHSPQTRVRFCGPDIENFALEAGLYLYDHRIWKKDASWANSRWTSNSFKSVDEWEDIYVFWKPGETIIDKSKLSKEEWIDWGDRSAWEIKSVRKNDDHPAKFPAELASRIIRIYSNAGDVILDPFMGSGTSALAALATDRDFVGLEKQQEYVDLARNKIDEFRLQPELV